MSRRRMISKVQLNQINVNNIDTTSGIFVGTNYAHNWSSHRKNNYGFGSVTNSQVINNYSVVVDHDLIDTPIYNSPTFHMDHDVPNENNIDIGEINVNALDSNAAIAVGENEMAGWSGHSKRNTGQGKLAGIVQNHQNSTQIFDEDLIDASINDIF